MLDGRGGMRTWFRCPPPRSPEPDVGPSAQPRAGVNPRDTELPDPADRPYPVADRGVELIDEIL